MSSFFNKLQSSKCLNPISLSFFLHSSPNFSNMLQDDTKMFEQYIYNRTNNRSEQIKTNQTGRRMTNKNCTLFQK